MRSKLVVQSILLLLLGASVVVWAVRSFGAETPAVPPPVAAPAAAVAPDATPPAATPDATPPAAQPAASPSPAPAVVLADGIAVINFHGTKR